MDRQTNSPAKQSISFPTLDLDRPLRLSALSSGPLSQTWYDGQIPPALPGDNIAKPRPTSLPVPGRSYLLTHQTISTAIANQEPRGLAGPQPPPYPITYTKGTSPSQLRLLGRRKPCRGLHLTTQGSPTMTLSTEIRRPSNIARTGKYNPNNYITDRKAFSKVRKLIIIQ